MPKDATKNVDRYKIRGGQLNEFEYNQNQEQFAEQKGKPPTAKKGTKSAKKAKNSSSKGASAKKLAARKAAKK